MGGGTALQTHLIWVPGVLDPIPALLPHESILLRHCSRIPLPNQTDLGGPPTGGCTLPVAIQHIYGGYSTNASYPASPVCG